MFDIETAGLYDSINAHTNSFVEIIVDNDVTEDAEFEIIESKIKEIA